MVQAGSWAVCRDGVTALYVWLELKDFVICAADGSPGRLFRLALCSGTAQIQIQIQIRVGGHDSACRGEFRLAIVSMFLGTKTAMTIVSSGFIFVRSLGYFLSGMQFLFGKPEVISSS